MSGSGAVEAIPRHIEIPDRLVRKICRRLSTRCHRRHATACPRSSLEVGRQVFHRCEVTPWREPETTYWNGQRSPGKIGHDVRLQHLDELRAVVAGGLELPGDAEAQLNVHREARIFLW